MGWREQINTRMTSATGYRIVRADRPVAKGAKKRPTPFPRYYDQETRAIIRAVRPWTMTSREKLFALVIAVRYVLDHEIPGEIVECGVWRGGSMQAIARVLEGRRVLDRELHLFDTFEGMPPPTAEDVKHGGPTAEQLLRTRPRTAHVWAIADLDDVQAGMSQLDYPQDRIHYHPGLVEDTIPDQAPQQIALLRLDTDWYASTKHELDHLYDRVPSGGVVIIDDYDYWEGSRKAVDEFIERTGARIMLAPMGSGRIAIKP
jgi:O-methyltransferase